MITSFYSERELQKLGFHSIGKDCKISRKACFYGIQNISIGNNVRIDDFCLLSGHIELGSNIHISAYVALYGAGGIIMEDYSGISPKSTIFSMMDDFSGNCLIGPIHDPIKTNVTGGTVILRKFVQIGAQCVVFPNLQIGEGSVIGAMSLVNKDVPEWGIYVGQPVRFLKKRSRAMMKLV